MENKFNRRTFLKTVFDALLAMIGAGVGGVIYAHNIEPSLLDLQSIEIKHPLIPKSFDGVRIVQFSDTHLGFQYNLSQLKKLIQTINGLQADLVFFTGDLMDEPNKYQEITKIGPILKELYAPLGKFSIYGNHDHGGYGSQLYKQIMMEAGFTLLVNQSVPIEIYNGDCIYLIGIDDAMLGRPDFKLALKQVPHHVFKILLSHAPDLADRAVHYNIQWQLSGHSHGGQVKLPLVGPLIIPPYAKKYPEGYYLVSGPNRLHLYVNRGLGTTRLPFRFMAKPELTIFTLKTETN